MSVVTDVVLKNGIIEVKKWDNKCLKKLGDKR